ncbi:MAG: hypothetical protein WKF84_06890 [Pyrinomonadaceae bacterium]
MLMAHDERRGPGNRLAVEMPVKAKWFDSTISGRMIESAGVTLNMSPSGTLIKMDRLPEVGTMLTICVDRHEASEINPERSPQLITISLKGIVLWVEEQDASAIAAIELDFTGSEEASEQLTYWMDKVYEPLVIETVLGEPAEPSVC